MRRRVGAALVALALAGPLAGCGGDGPDEGGGPAPSASAAPRPVTTEESERLAISRYRNYERERVAFEMVVPVDAGTVNLRGRADMREHRAIAAGLAPGEPPAYALFAWNLATAGFTQKPSPVTDEEVDAAAKVPRKAWAVRPLERSSEPLDQVSLVLLNLALDRADNAQLLRQNGAEWRGSTVVQGVEVDVMTATGGGAQTLTYYVDGDGVMRRVDVALGGPQPATITFLDEETADVGAVPVVAALGPPPSTEPSGELAGG